MKQLKLTFDDNEPLRLSNLTLFNANEVSSAKMFNQNTALSKETPQQSNFKDRAMGLQAECFLDENISDDDQPRNVSQIRCLNIKDQKKEDYEQNSRPLTTIDVANRGHNLLSQFSQRSPFGQSRLSGAVENTRQTGIGPGSSQHMLDSQIRKLDENKSGQSSPSPQKGVRSQTSMQVQYLQNNKIHQRRLSQYSQCSSKPSQQVHKNEAQKPYQGKKKSNQKHLASAWVHPSTANENKENTQQRIPVQKDFQKAYKNLAQQIIKRTLCENQSMGKTSLIINEKDIHRFAKQNQHNSYKGSPKKSVQSIDPSLKAKVAEMVSNDMMSARMSQSVLSNRESLEGGSVPGYQRLYQHGQRKMQERQSQSKKDPEEQAFLNCSFQPQLVTRRKSHDSKLRSYTQFYEDQKHHQQKLIARRDSYQKREEQEELKELFRCKSANISHSQYYDKIKHRFPQPSLTTSQQDPKKQHSSGSVNMSFQPEINKRSHFLRRNGSVDEILYSDAQRREEKLNEKRVQRDKSLADVNKFAQKASDLMLADRLSKEIQDCCAQLDINLSLDFSQFGKLMYNLGYYRKTNKFSTNQLYRHFGLKKRSIQKVNFDDLLQDAFSLISGDQKTVSLKSAKVLIFALNNMCFKWMLSPSRHSSPKILSNQSQDDHFIDLSPTSDDQQSNVVHPQLNQESHNFKQQPAKTAGQVHDGNFYLSSPNDCKGLIQKYYGFTDNRKIFLQTEKKRKANVQQNHDKSSTLRSASQLGKVLPKSQKLAQAHYNEVQSQMQIEKLGQKVHHYDILHKKNEGFLRKQKQLQQEKQKGELVGCTFQPKVNQFKSKKRDSTDTNKQAEQGVHNYLYKQARPKAKEKNPLDLDYEKNKSECTFKPNIARRKGAFGARRGSMAQLKPSEKREMELEVKISSPQSQSDRDMFSETKDFIEKSPESEVRDLYLIGDRIPLLFLDTNLGNSEMERIVIFDGDDPIDVAERFCSEHGLDEKKKEKLVGVITAHLKSILPKIDEEQD